MLCEVDLNKNGELELAEFFQVFLFYILLFSACKIKNGFILNDCFQLYSGLKGGQVSHNRLVRYLDETDDVGLKATKVTRSGGGL